jgi:hypothetical protein
MQGTATSIDPTDQTHPIRLSGPATHRAKAPIAPLKTAMSKQALTADLGVPRRHNVHNPLISNRKWTRPPHFANKRSLKMQAPVEVPVQAQQKTISNAVDRAPTANPEGELTKPMPEAPFIPELTRHISKIPLADVPVDVGSGVDAKNVESRRSWCPAGPSHDPGTRFSLIQRVNTDNQDNGSD